MAQQNAAATIRTAGDDYDAVVAQLATLRNDVSKLAGTVADAAGHRGQALSAELSDGGATRPAISAARQGARRRRSRAP